jgi:hypothetical protein
VLSAVLGWPVIWTNFFLGAVTIVYTVAGGSRAVSRTQTAQMAVVFVGLLVAFGVAIALLPPGFSFGRGVALAGALGKLQGVDPSLRLDTRYTLWSGLLGGLFVQLAYFGTDQSQVQRYLAGGPLAESRRGLLMNGLLKVPMQLFILFLGVMVFVVYQLSPPPLFFNRAELERVRASHPAEVARLESTQARLFVEKRQAIDAWLANPPRRPSSATQRPASRRCAGDRCAAARTRPGADPKDADFIFLRFVLDHFPADSSGCWSRSSSRRRCPPTPPRCPRSGRPRWSTSTSRGTLMRRTGGRWRWRAGRLRRGAWWRWGSPASPRCWTTSSRR